ncbi:MAG: phosphoribosylformylglycinamidine synthase [Patescibacteria group bacterium]|jgi:phosphoribosylformylglycinamidine synthase
MINRYYRLLNPQLELCFNVEVTSPLSDNEELVLFWLLAETFQKEDFGKESMLKSGKILEIGPRLSFATPWNTNALSILKECGLNKVVRIEKSRRLLNPVSQSENLTDLYDQMTECIWDKIPESFLSIEEPKPVLQLPLLEKGIEVFSEIPDFKAMDDFDRQFYYDYFVGELNRNPTFVEIMDLNNANSEHSRHGYFRGKQIIDGKLMPETLMEIVKSTLKGKNEKGSLVAFKDNSSVIMAYDYIKTLIPQKPGKISNFVLKSLLYHLSFTAETHNFPSGIAPFPGAETGGGGRIRDGQAVGIGGLIIAGTAGYCVGNLGLPFCLWEKKGANPKNLASPLDILIGASNGASDYGNKFGEPLISGFVRTSALTVNNERREWLKPIMFTGGIGQIDRWHLEKMTPQEGMLIIQIGGPAYRIGFGGGSASSLMQGENKSDLDFNAVQRGDAEMEQKMNRVIRACVEMGKNNPIISLHDQGAGGPANVLKELVEKTGGRIDIRKIQVGDPTMSVLEIWVCEYQERLGLVIDPSDLKIFQKICKRERVNCEVLGEVTGDGYFIVEDSQAGALNPEPVRMDLAKVLGGMPQKTFSSETIVPELYPLIIPEGIVLGEILSRVLKLPSVGSKRFLTNKVDRSVTGLVAQQQCCGPFQLPVSDYAMVSQSHFPDERGKYSGAVTSIGEQPIKMLVDPSAGARMAVAEAFTNMMFAQICWPNTIKCSANWMGAPKLPGEGAKMYSAASAMRDLMLKLGMAVDGGKDSLSMATKVFNHDENKEELVKSPLQLVISAYAPTADITKKVSPDIKESGNHLVFIDLANGKKRLGGSALAQVFGQIGNDCPDVEDPELLVKTKEIVNILLENNLIVSGHDISDGGLIVSLLEMAFSGNSGFIIHLPEKKDEIFSRLFSEELGLIIEISERTFEIAKAFFSVEKIPFIPIGFTGPKDVFIFGGDSELVFSSHLQNLFSDWDTPSYELEKFQTNLKCVEEERQHINFSKSGISYDFHKVEKPVSRDDCSPKVAILRSEGSNGDREMTSAFYLAGFDPYDVHLSDLLSGKTDLSDYQGIAFVGGFSYADVLDSAKGWAGIIKFNERLSRMFADFYNRPDTFSFGVCNGCQLATLLGWVPFDDIIDSYQPRFIKNTSGRFESRWSRVAIFNSPSIMLKGMEHQVLGVWSAHGEGRFFADKEVLQEILAQNLAPIMYVDWEGAITEEYPFNPNGSALGIAGICDPTGRHLAMMPHPERSFLNWQWPYKNGLPENGVSPWLTMFINAREWCERNR